MAQAVTSWREDISLVGELQSQQLPCALQPPTPASGLAGDLGPLNFKHARHTWTLKELLL